MKKILLSIFLATLLLADVQTLIQKYKQGDYKYVCLNGYKLFSKLKKDEDLLSMYAFSCLKADYINRLAVPILILGKTPASRKNRAYFSLILAQKNLLISALSDHEEFSGLNVPNTDHIISKVFNLYFQKKYKKSDNVYIMRDPKIAGVEYKVFIVKKSLIPYLRIDVYKNGKKTDTHLYR